MKELLMYGEGLITASALFWMFTAVIDFWKNPDYNILAISLIILETVIMLVGIAIGIYASWRLWHG
ncbi:MULTISPECIES: hypothetical protein [Limosilactobacillus]|uniref:hypothetical protein n=1 Tax=Limosilactobacillus TaxID=2742598 RepID=UPI000A1E0F4F|nr:MULTISPECIES: hypothetical protein [Limosilactobacillus]MQB58341.1 hypothetical protein [Limosilactobacillus reuteri]MQB82494.1 hypothetical protein [Limosilactobacillus reuteri]MQB84115.1 hypothetical protein [Limosilactobacillus reuteri]MQB88480.1 hypothetical protein [Limosilactobacillus reuteri]MQB94445.1 hypothetical protein [Limosilactobacillus reuteri]